MGDQNYSDTCIFCRLAKGLVRADIIFEDDAVIAFNDIHPQAPTHVLVIPRQHITALWETDDSHNALLGRILLVCNRVAQQQGIMDSGYRVVVNTGADAGQSVDHVHFHVLGGRKLQWPPG
ncbi:MAG TPA: histidine triad nucleotide-binding protein [Chloroflexia bacterium]|nr:histidine triad nucleotide-binding protein [Chloroflexia bacterium]